MNSMQLSERLSALEHDRDVQNVTLDEKAKAIVAAFPLQVRQWIEREIRSVVGAHPAITEQHGERLSEMKNEMKALLAKMPQMVQEMIGSSGTWPHRDEKFLTAAVQVTDRRNDYWGDGFRKCINGCGALLQKYSYMKDASVSSVPWRIGSDGKITYFSALDIKGAELNSYEASLAAAVSKWREILDFRQQLRKAKASESWDQA